MISNASTNGTSLLGSRVIDPIFVVRRANVTLVRERAQGLLRA
jgi:hypothetical protein